jgi:hypothetical protein
MVFLSYYASGQEINDKRRGRGNLRVLQHSSICSTTGSLIKRGQPWFFLKLPLVTYELPTAEEESIAAK